MAEAATDKVVRGNLRLAFGREHSVVSNSTRVGPRGVNWRPDKEATLYWTECQDEEIRETQSAKEIQETFLIWLISRSQPHRQMRQKRFISLGYD